VGLARTERLVRERMTLFDQSVDSITPQKLINPKALTAVIRDFFGRSQLSQFMDQINPLAELTHKRRLSALGPGGLNRERAGFEVRDVHPSHYGRICPIETPEGPNIGLINSLSTYARVNEFGFIETPYRKVEGRAVTDKIDYLTADQEENYVIAQANARSTRRGPLSARSPSVPRRLPRSRPRARSTTWTCRPSSSSRGRRPDSRSSSTTTPTARSWARTCSARACRCCRPSALVGTGIEERVARDSKRVVVVAESAGIVASSTRQAHRGHQGREAAGAPRSSSRPQDDPKGGGVVYELRKFMRSNAGTCFNQKPIVKKGQKVKKGDVLADGPATDKGELALGRNVLVAFMPWNGYNFEDAILISERRWSRRTSSPRSTSRSSRSAPATPSSGRRRSPATSRTSARRRSRTSTTTASSASAPR
jgi:DNA-directed RNA polymerase subunit beta